MSWSHDCKKKIFFEDCLITDIFLFSDYNYIGKRFQDYSWVQVFEADSP